MICVTTCFFFSSSCLPLLSSLSPLFFVSELSSYCSSTSFCFVCYFLQSLPHRPSTSPSFFFSLPFRPLKFSDFSYHYPFPLFTIFMSLKLFFFCSFHSFTSSSSSYCCFSFVVYSFAANAISSHFLASARSLTVSFPCLKCRSAKRSVVCALLAAVVRLWVFVVSFLVLVESFFFLLFIFIHICFYSLIIGVLYDPHVEFYGACFHHSPEELRLINLPRRVPSEFPRSSLPLVAPPGVPLGPRRLRENASPGLTWATHLSIVSPTVKLELNFPS